MAPRDSSLRRPTLQCLVATGVLLFSLFLVMQDLASSNRPHELHNAPWVAGITLLNLVPCVGGLRGLVGYARQRRGRARYGVAFFALALWLVVVAIINVLVLAGAASTAPAGLGGGFGAYKTRTPHLFFGNLAPQETAGETPAALVWDFKGKTLRVKSDQIEVVSIDSQAPGEILGLDAEGVRELPK